MPEHGSRDFDAIKQQRFAVMERVVLDRVRGLRRVLDLGCGDGRLTVQLQASQVIGLDRDRLALERTRSRGVLGVLGDAHGLPFYGGVFDAVISTDSAFVVLDLALACAEAARVLRPGGLLIVHLPTDRVLSLRRPFGLVTVPNGDPRRAGTELVRHARHAALALREARLYRWLRVFPYLVRAPSCPGLRVWSHGIFVFERRG